jgi:hypothetical protein
MLRLTCLVSWAVTLAFASSALAQDSRAAQARKHCLTGNVEAGVALLADLFVETKDVNLIYNQARCYEQNGRADAAILRFREYLRVAKNISPDEKAEVDRHIADCRAMLAEGKPAEPVPVPPSPAPLPVEPPGTPLAADTVTTASPPPASGSSTRLAGIVVGSAGLAALATGGLFSYLVSSAKQEAEDNADKKIYDSGLQSRGKTYETMQWVCYGTGAALVATGVVLYAVGARKAKPAPVAVVPRLAPGQGGLLLEGRF